MVVGAGKGALGRGLGSIDRVSGEKGSPIADGEADFNLSIDPFLRAISSFPVVTHPGDVGLFLIDRRGKAAEVTPKCRSGKQPELLRTNSDPEANYIRITPESGEARKADPRMFSISAEVDQ